MPTEESPAAPARARHASISGSPLARVQQVALDAVERRLWQAGHLGPLAALTRWRARPWLERQRRRLATAPDHLNHFEDRVRSQNGEDGLVREVFRRIGSARKTFVEVGAGDGSENLTRALADAGWSGVWIEADEAAAARARAAVADGGEGKVRVACARVGRDGVRAALAAAGADAEPDLLAIDVDGNDYWLWQEIASAHRPRVVVIEYNASFRPGVVWVMPYAEDHRWDGSRRFGASLEALVALGRRLGYRLVACDAHGVNAFFVRADLTFRGGFPGTGTAAEHYWPPAYGGACYGHPPDLPADPPAALAAPADDFNAAGPVVAIEGFEMALRRDDRVVSEALLRDRTWEPLERDLVLREIRSGDVVVDVGANLGYYTLHTARAVGPAGRVFAFEPDPVNFALLEENVRRNRLDNVDLRRCAVGEAAGSAALFLSFDNSGDHRLYDSGDGRRGIDVEVVALDDALAPHLERVALVKMDIQGGELGAVRGMRRLLERNRRLRLMIEFWPFGLQRCGGDPKELLDLLAAADLVLYDLDAGTGALERIDDAAALLERYRPELENFTNLVCVARAHAAAWESRQDPRPRARALDVRWEGDFAALERGDGPDPRWRGEWRWCGPRGRLWLTCWTPGGADAEIAMALAGARAEVAEIRIASELFSATVAAGLEPVAFRREVHVPHGRHAIDLACDAPPLATPGDARVLVFRVLDFRLVRDARSAASAG